MYLNGCVCMCEPHSKSFLFFPFSDNFACAAQNPDHRSLFFCLHDSSFQLISALYGSSFLLLTATCITFFVGRGVLWDH